jgi:hypothetical protein
MESATVAVAFSSETSALTMRAAQASRAGVREVLGCDSDHFAVLELIGGLRAHRRGCHRATPARRSSRLARQARCGVRCQRLIESQEVVQGVTGLRPGQRLRSRRERRSRAPGRRPRITEARSRRSGSCARTPWHGLVAKEVLRGLSAGLRRSRKRSKGHSLDFCRIRESDRGFSETFLSHRIASETPRAPFGIAWNVDGHRETRNFDHVDRRPERLSSYPRLRPTALSGSEVA